MIYTPSKTFAHRVDGPNGPDLEVRDYDLEQSFLKEMGDAGFRDRIAALREPCPAEDRRFFANLL